MTIEVMLLIKPIVFVFNFYFKTMLKTLSEDLKQKINNNVTGDIGTATRDFFYRRYGYTGTGFQKYRDTDIYTFKSTLVAYFK